MTNIDMPEEPWFPKRQQTAIEKLQEEMNRHLAPLREWERLQRQLAPLRQLEEIERQLRPIRELEKIQRQLRPLGELEELRKLSLLRQWDGLPHSVNTQAQRLLEQYLPITQLAVGQESLRSMAIANARISADHAHGHSLRAIAEHQEWYNRLERQATGGLSLQELARQLQRANPALNALAEAQKSLDIFAGAFRNVDPSIFELDDDEEREAEQAVEVITQAAAAEPTLQEAVTQIIAAIEAQQNPSVQLTLWLFFKKLIDWIICGVIGVVISQHMPDTTSRNPPAVVKSIKEAARGAVDSKELLGEYRIVTAENLNVRHNPKARSPKLGTLSFGKVVRLVKKDKDFALVHWKDTESGLQIEGWVFARYLEKLN